jgi:hypothetical protein
MIEAVTRAKCFDLVGLKGDGVVLIYWDLNEEEEEEGSNYRRIIPNIYTNGLHLYTFLAELSAARRRRALCRSGICIVNVP